ncbi:tetratricopeptide repeat protein [Streptomyces sp. NRRL B-24484]|uniref:tetratricopeptide repeat protein n=1 Tax=Streptomyces sp. NRRL B-24484 TaxID=1463833 RepID=UPI0007C4B955|nr:tetratricopeptide repeat protein [Streptomyces sp. NRRL B-24484]
MLGPDHPRVLSTRASLAHWRGEAGDAAGTVAALEQVLADRIRVLGPDHPDTLSTRGNLAYWRGETGDGAGALTAYEDLLTDQEQVLGPDHPDTLSTRGNLAYWRGETGDGAGAITAYEDLLTDRERVLGPDHPDTLGARINLVGMLVKRGRQLVNTNSSSPPTIEGSVKKMPDDREPQGPSWFGQALTCFQGALDLTDPDKDPGSYGVILHDIADTHRAVGDNPQAAAYYRQSIEYKYRADSPADLATTMIAFGDCLIDCGEPVEALAALDQAGEIIGQVREATRQAVGFRDLGLAYERLGNRGIKDAYTKALNNYQASLKLINPEIESGSYATVLRDIGDVHKAQGRLSEAHASYKEALEHLRRHDGSERVMASLLISLGRISRQIGTLGGNAPPDGESGQQIESTGNPRNSEDQQQNGG